MKYKLFILFLLILFIQQSFCVCIYTSDGKKFCGDVIRETDKFYTIMTNQGKMTIYKSLVTKKEYFFNKKGPIESPLRKKEIKRKLIFYDLALFLVCGFLSWDYAKIYSADKDMIEIQNMMTPKNEEFVKNLKGQRNRHLTFSITFGSVAVVSLIKSFYDAK